MEELYSEVFRSINQFSRLRMKPLFDGLSKNEYVMLMTIERANRRQGSITISEIAEELQVLAPAVSRTLRTLEKQGLVARAVGSTDRRNTFVCLTEQGRNLLLATRARVNGLVREVLAQIDEAETRRLVQYLDHAYELCEKQLERKEKEIKESGNE